MNYETTIEPGAARRRDLEMHDSGSTGLSAPLRAEGLGHDDLSGDEYHDGDVAVAKKRARKRWVIFAIIAALVLAAVAYFLMAGEEEVAPEVEQVPVVSVVSPGNATIEGSISATGTLAARRTLPVGVAGEGGRVVAVPVDAGDWVSEGQTLAIIDRSVQNQQAAGASAQVQVAQADADLAQSNLDRALQLVERGFISKADVDRLTATRDAAVARVRVARAQAAELRARNERLNVTAPASGLVLERNVEPGQIVGAGSGALFVIARGGEMELMARVGEDDLSRLSVGASAQVTPVGSEQTLTGQIWQLAPTIDEQTRQGTARIALSYDPALRPGGFASAVINSGTVVAPVLPESAILSDEQGSYVLIVGEGNRLVRRAVTTGSVTGQGITVTGGLSGRERIVLRAGGFYSEGDVIDPQQVRQGS
ncbi:efflux RND transporter periplasmic adaptor subunit [Pseudopontixanthobacter vadosimaris]|uniref:efflux RND transporter periplasmic adaptor subunit n=1 Tax=Pseudopontixanthobacter vadosimaris TaxID=2726450 RepID=UPI00147583A6|nr:efflux RND transporter periplasmic adaptor subunit [Pseudopontixanthobacter vadosimaris]